MKIARYWQRSDIEMTGRDGYPYTVTGWGWSNSDEQEAKQRAVDSAQAIVARLTAGQGFPDGYEYLDRPRREEIVKEVRGDDGELIAAVTRNHYGSLVLNTASMMFIDIDLPVESGFASFVRSVKQMFGLAAQSPADRKRAEIRAAAARFPGATFRVYRTLAGFRIAVMHKRISPGSAESAEMFAAFGSDPLYVRLCARQESFRARLTPKYWRCGGPRPSFSFPYETPQARDAHESWKRAYDAACSTFASCTFVEQIGTRPALADHVRLSRLHDTAARAESQLPLA